MKKKNEPWFHIKNVLKDSTKEITNGFKEIALMLKNKKNN